MKNFYLRKKTKICIYKTFLRASVCLRQPPRLSRLRPNALRLFSLRSPLQPLTHFLISFTNAAETWRAAKPFACEWRRKPEPVMARFLHSKKPPKYEIYSGIYRARFLSVSKTSTLLIFRFELFERSRPFSERIFSIFL